MHGANAGVLRFSVSSSSSSSSATRTSRRDSTTASKGPSRIQPYTEGQIEQVVQQLEGIIKDATDVSLQTLHPTVEQRRRVMDIIIAHVKKHRRKIYGGMAIDKYLRMAHAEGIYDFETEVPDLDIFSPDPVYDVKAMCDTLHAAGLGPVKGVAAQHVDTFKIRVGDWACCDISYVFRYIFNKIPAEEFEDGVKYTHPSFMFIDYLRLINDPLTSYWRLDKAFPRFAKLQLQYPLPSPARVVDVNRSAREVFSFDPVKVPIVQRLIKNVVAVDNDNNSIVVIGLAAYNTLMSLAAANDNTNPNPNLDPDAHAVMLDLLTVEYAKDAAHIYDMLVEEGLHVVYEEYHPFSDFLGHRGIFSYDAGGGRLIPIVRIFDNKHKCVPFMEIDMTLEQETIKVRLGAFTVVIMFLMMLRFRVRVEDRNQPLDALAMAMYDNMITNLYRKRNAFLSDHGKTILDPTPFKEFVIPCVGEAVQAVRLNEMVHDMMYRKYKQRGLKYEPSKSGSADFNPSSFLFLNSSGNLIKSQRDCLFVPPRQSADEPK